MTRRRLALVVVAAAVVTAAVVGGGGLLRADSTTPGTTTAPPEAADDTPDEAVAALHREGVTGDGVDVGVVDVTGYAVDHPDLADHVAETRAFDESADARSGGRYTHGTASAATVAAVAPDADLHLTTVTSPVEFRRAVRWLLDRGVDVVVAPVSFYGRPDDGSSAVAAAAARATDRGVVFVAPAGNLGQRHWERRDDGGERLEFGDEDRTGLRGDAERLVLWLSWDRAHREENYTALLYREDALGTHVVARSTPYRDDAVPSERLTASIEPRGQYFVEVRGPDRPTGATVELESPTHRLEHARSRGSIAAPATASGVLGVGAYDRERERLAPYTSRGPTADGRPGVDLAAPAVPIPNGEAAEYAGSSLSAAYVAGVTALLLSADPAPPPRRVEQALAATATDVGPPGHDLGSGFGLVEPVGAARRVGAAPANRSRELASTSLEPPP